MPTGLDAIYDEISQLLHQRRFDEALSILQHTETDETRFLYAWIRCLSQQGRVDEALTCCELLHTTYHDPRVPVLAPKICSKEPISEADALTELTLLCAYEEAGRLFRQERYADALAALDEAGQHGHAEFVYARAQCLGLVGRIEEAISCCDFLERRCHDHRGPSLRDRLRGTRPSSKTKNPKSVPDHGPVMTQALAEARAERDQLREALKQQRATLDVATQRLAAFGDSGPALLRQVQELATDIEYSRAQAKALEDARAERERLRVIIEQQRGNLETATHQIAELKSVNAALLQQNQGHDADVERMREQTVAALQAVEGVRGERDQLKGTVEQQRINLEGAARLIAELKSANNAFQQQNQAQNLELEKVRAQVLVAEQAMANAIAERDQFKATIERQEANLQGTTQVIAEIKAAYADLQQQVHVLTFDLEQSQEQVQAVAPTIADAQAERDQIKGLLEQMKIEKTQMMQHMAEREALVISLQQYVNSLQQMAEVLTADVERFRTQEENASHALEAACTERDHLRRMLEQREIAGSNVTLRLTENEVVAAALQKQIIALAEEVTPLFAVVRSSLNLLAQEVAKIEQDRVKTAVDPESRATKRRRSLLATPPPMHFSGNAIETIYSTDETDRAANLRRRRE